MCLQRSHGALRCLSEVRLKRIQHSLALVHRRSSHVLQHPEVQHSLAQLLDAADLPLAVHSYQEAPVSSLLLYSCCPQHQLLADLHRQAAMSSRSGRVVPSTDE